MRMYFSRMLISRNFPSRTAINNRMNITTKVLRIDSKRSLRYIPILNYLSWYIANCNSSINSEIGDKKGKNFWPNSSWKVYGGTHEVRYPKRFLKSISTFPKKKKKSIRISIDEFKISQNLVKFSDAYNSSVYYGLIVKYENLRKFELIIQIQDEMHSYSNSRWDALLRIVSLLWSCCCRFFFLSFFSSNLSSFYVEMLSEFRRR